MEDEPEWSARRVYHDHINQLDVAEAGMARPLSAVERSMQRYRVRNRPALPDSRQNLILLPEHSVTTKGRALVLIDDGQADRILVFATNEQLQRFSVLLFYFFTYKNRGT